MLVVPAGAAARAPTASRAVSAAAVAAAAERDTTADLGALLADAGERLAPAPASLVAAARAFARATLRRRFTQNPKP